MTDDLNPHISQVKQALAALEAQRAALGDAVVETALAALRKELSTLENQVPARQRKQVTLLFADVVGSTRIATHLEPEENLEIMDAALKRLAAPVEAHGGHVTRFQGDGFKALFGAPRALENDPEQAVRAGLKILEVAHEIADELLEQHGIQDFKVRVGANTGWAALGGQTESEDTVMGETVVLGKRMESAASPDSLLISHSTYQHVSGLFDVIEQEPIQAKGFAEPVRVYQVQGVRPRTFRVPTRGVAGVETLMVGRQFELDTLRQAFNRLRQEQQGGFCAVIGEAGIGKSRLLAEFQTWLGTQPTAVNLLQGRAGPEMQHRPYALLREVFAMHFQIQESEALSEVWRKLEDGFTLQDERSLPTSPTQTAEQSGRARAHVVGQLLGYDFSASPYVQPLLDDPQQLRDRALRYLEDYLGEIAQSAPTLLFLDDLHWADDSSLELVDYLARQLPELPLLLVTLTRPSLFERQPDWAPGGEQYIRLDLQLLSSQESQQLVAEILKAVPNIPESLNSLILHSAEGNPFYMEELVKMLIDRGDILVREAGWQVAAERLTALQVPPTLAGVLQARLDSLPAAEQQVLKQASVVGRLFWDHAVAHLAHQQGTELDEYALHELLRALDEKALVSLQDGSTFQGADAYLFHHELLREMAYSMVVKRLRQQYHGWAAQWLIEQGQERSAEFAGLIADHLEAAGQGEQALPYLRLAGDQAALRYANQAATAYYTRALNLVDPHDLDGRYQLLLAREKVWEIQGEREPQQRDLITLAETAQALNDPGKQAEAALRQIIYYTRTGDFPAALDRIGGAIQLAQQAEDPRIEAALHAQWGIALWRQGDTTSARSPLEQALNMAEAAQLTQVEAESIRTLGPAFAQTLSDAEGKVRFQAALEKYRQAGDKRGEAYSLNNLGSYYTEIRRDPKKARRYLQEALEAWRATGDRRGEALTLYNLGMVACEQDDVLAAVEWMEQSLTLRQEVADRWGESLTQVQLARCYASLGAYHQVEQHAEQALNISRQIGHHRGEAEAYEVFGNYFRDLGAYERAMVYYEKAGASQQQGAAPQAQARLQFSLGLLCHQTGDQSAALSFAQKGLELLQNQEHPELKWLGYLCQGHALAALEDLTEAEQAYQQAVSTGYQWRKNLRALEASVGLAGVLCTRGEANQALSRVERVLSFIGNTTQPEAGKTQPEAENTRPEAENRLFLQGALEPLRMLWTCYQVLHAAEDQRAADLLNKTYLQLQKRASRIPDPQLRFAYIHQVAAHHAINTAFEEQRGR